MPLVDLLLLLHSVLFSGFPCSPSCSPFTHLIVFLFLGDVHLSHVLLYSWLFSFKRSSAEFSWLFWRAGFSSLSFYSTSICIGISWLFFIMIVVLHVPWYLYLLIYFYIFILESYLICIGNYTAPLLFSIMAFFALEYLPFMDLTPYSFCTIFFCL